MIANLPKVDGTVVQTEDEIAAATMAIGANYAGVRGFTASAGPGLSLMMESIGLSGMTETPLVIINTQRWSFYWLTNKARTIRFNANDLWYPW